MTPGGDAVPGLTPGAVAAFNLAVVLAALGPGPAFLLCVDTSLRGGRKAGMLCGLGLAIVAGLWTLAALAGLDALFDAFPFAYTTLRIGGGVLIVLFAVQIWRTAKDPVDISARAGSKRRAFFRGAALNLGNPKSILFSAGVLLVIFPPGLSAADMAFVTANHIALEAVVYAVLAFVLSRRAVRRRYLAFKPTLNRAMALVLGGLGLRLLIMG